jgi:hypothetical protein
VIEVASLDALVTVAEKYESVIVEHGSTYLVWDDGMLFRYGTERAGAVSTAEQPSDEAIVRLKAASATTRSTSPAKAPTPKARARAEGTRRKPSS